MSGWKEPKYEDVQSWNIPEPEHFFIIAGLIRGALEDFAAYVAEREPKVSTAKVMEYLAEWGQARQLPIAQGDVRFWDDVMQAPREYPPFTDSGQTKPSPANAPDVQPLDPNTDARRPQTRPNRPDRG